ncbi:XAC0095 family protein [Luteimonas sp. RIT-PG2_3]
MSHVDSHAPATPGYFLTQDSQCRLKHIRDHIAFLLRQAQARTHDRCQAGSAQITAADLAVGLEFLSEQANRIMADLAWWPGLPSSLDEPRTGTSDYGTARYVYGVTLDQFDALDRLIETLSAHGDVVAAAHTAELATRTLPLLGQAICDGTQAVRSLLVQLEAQGLRQRGRPRNEVGEERGTYGHAPQGAANVQRLPPMTRRPRAQWLTYDDRTHH